MVMKTTKEIRKTFAQTLPYTERLRKYEADKTKLLQEMRGASAEVFSEKLKELADKWGI